MKHLRKEKRVITSSPRQTHEFGKMIAGQIRMMRPGKRAVVLGLQGELGSGKTTFVQGFTKELGIKEKVLSPTFVILKKYEIPSTKPETISKFTSLYHIDCYRLEKPKELFRLGFKEIIADPQNIIIIEWADRIKTVLPQEAAWFIFAHKQKTARSIRACVPQKRSSKDMV